LFCEGAAAVFAYRTACIRRETGEPHGLRGMETQVYVREPDGWKLAHVHYSGEAIPR
jgi:ketosteroid isomerase-like protein